MIQGTIIPLDGPATVEDTGLGTPGNRPAVQTKPSTLDTGPRYATTQTFNSSADAINAAKTEPDKTLRRAQINATLSLNENDPTHVGLIFEDCVIDGGYSLYGLDAYSWTGSPDTSKPVEFRYCEIKNATAAAVVSHDVRLLRCHIHHGVDGVKAARNSEFYACLINDCIQNPGSHVDAIQVGGGATNVLFHWCAIDATVASDSPENAGGNGSGGLQTNTDGTITMEMNDNWVNGGGYTLRGGGSSGQVNQVFRRNKHGRVFTFGPIAFMNQGASDYDSSNVWEDDGMPVLGS